MAGQKSGSEPTSGGNVVKYVGTADERVIRKSDWASVGVEDQELVRWDSKNKFSVPVSELSQGAVEYLDAQDGFKLQSD